MKMIKKNLLILFLLTVSVYVEAQTVTDILGREVEISDQVGKVILGEGRFLAAFGVLEINNPLSRVAGMLNEFRKFDPATFQKYKEIYPEIDSIPVFGQTSEDTVSIEKIISLKPDVAIFGVEGHGPKARSKVIIDTLKAVGIPIIFIDFRQQPLKNTAKSIEIIGQILGQEKQAEAFSSLYKTELTKITDRLAKNATSCPTVLLEIRVGLGEECCMTISRGMFADMIEQAGACNIAKDVLPGEAGLLNLEYVITNAPDIYIGTAVGSMKGPMSGKGRIVLGAGIEETTARSSLEEALQRAGINSLPAVQNKRAHAIWHHFYNSPLNLYAFQKFAKWFHPELFKDIEPEKTLEKLLGLFKPVDLSGVYAVSLSQ
jgi:iron complex transport system substrate-binding protein